MNRDVQRTFVLLRQCGSGRESGYARAETRDGRVKLNLVVQGFSNDVTPYAFAVTRDGLLFVGQLNMDARGQGGIAADLSAQDLKAMQILFVAYMQSETVSIPLAGTVGRGGWADWAQIRQLVAETLMPVQNPVAETLAQSEKTTRGEEAAEAAPIASEEEPQPVVVQEQTEETHDYEPARPEFDQPEPVRPGSMQPESLQQEPDQMQDEISIYDLPAQEDPFEAVERELRTPLPQEKRLEMPALLRNAYWPQLLWPLHDLFERFETVHPFADQSDTVYIRVPLGGKWGTISHYLVGAYVKDGWVTGVGYLIPGEHSETAPSGLAGYEWKNGYWQAWQYMENE